MVSKIKELIDSAGLNPHQISIKTGVTYRIILGLYNKKTVSPDTKIGTLQAIANELGVRVDDLYVLKPGLR